MTAFILKAEDKHVRRVFLEDQPCMHVDDGAERKRMEANAMVHVTGSEGLNCVVSDRWAVTGGLDKCNR